MVDLKERQELGWLLGATAGRVLGAPYALLIGQEQAGKMLAGSRKEDHEDVVRRMEEQYPEELANTAVRLGGPHTWDDIKRIWHNPRVGLLMRLIGTAATPIHNLAGALARSSYYNPFSDTATVYGNVPAITAGVLGRAADFNRRRFEAPIFDRAARSAYHAAGSLVDGHPVGLLQAMRGASRATQAAGDDEQRAEMRRWLWPSVAISAVPLAGLAGSVFLPKQTEAVASTVVDAARDVLRRAGVSAARADSLAPMLALLGALGAPAVAGRGLGYVVSRVEKRRSKNDRGRKPEDAKQSRR